MHSEIERQVDGVWRCAPWEQVVVDAAPMVAVLGGISGADAPSALTPASPASWRAMSIQGVSRPLPPSQGLPTNTATWAVGTLVSLASEGSCPEAEKLSVHSLAYSTLPSRAAGRSIVPTKSFRHSNSSGVVTTMSLGTGRSFTATPISIAFFRLDPLKGITTRRSTSLSGPASPRATEPNKMIRRGLKRRTIRSTISSMIGFNRSRCIFTLDCYFCVLCRRSAAARAPT